MVNCGVCNKAIGASTRLKLTCNDCSREFHPGCPKQKVSKADIDYMNNEGIVWRCDGCDGERRKSLRFDSVASEGKLSLEEIMTAITELKDEHKKTEQSVNRAFESLNEKLDENHNAFLEESKKTENYFKILEELVTENKSLKDKVRKLEDKVEDLEQYSRSNQIEIHGIQREAGENVLDVVKEVGKALDIEILDSMIDTCHRLGNRQNNSAPGIIVSFVRRFDKEEFLRKRRVKRNLNTTHINRQGTSNPIYVNESLSFERRRLLAAARAVKRDKAYTFLWVRHGRILLRKDENSPVIVVTRQEDLSKL